MVNTSTQQKTTFLFYKLNLNAIKVFDKEIQVCYLYHKQLITTKITVQLPCCHLKKCKASSIKYFPHLLVESN